MVMDGREWPRLATPCELPTQVCNRRKQKEHVCKARRLLLLGKFAYAQRPALAVARHGYAHRDAVQHALV